MIEQVKVSLKNEQFSQFSKKNLKQGKKLFLKQFEICGNFSTLAQCLIMYNLKCYDWLCHKFTMEHNFSKISTNSIALNHKGCARYGHKAISVGDEILLVGGTNQSADYSTSIMKFNLENCRFDEPSIEANINLEGFSAFSFKGQLYLWGGNTKAQITSTESKASNNLLVFDGIKCKSSRQYGTIPSPRAFHASVFFANRYLLVYGGFNNLQIFEDWFIFDAETKQWKIIEVNPLPNLSCSCQMGWINGRGFLILSETASLKGNKISVDYKTEIYEFRVTDFDNPQLQLSKISSHQPGPEPRTHPSVTFYDKYIFLIGGEKLAENRQSLFDDVWCFNLQTLTWKKFDLFSNVKFGSEVIFYQHKLYLFGGVTGNDSLNDTVEILPISHDEKFIEKRVCQVCETIYVPLQQRQEKLNFKLSKLQPQIYISVSFLAKFAKMIKNPLHALGLLVDNSLNMNATVVSISLNIQKKDRKYYKNDLNYLLIADNSKVFDSLEMAKQILFSFWYKSETAEEKEFVHHDFTRQYSLNLKMASLRLGKSCLLVTESVQKEKFVIYFSVSDMDSPESNRPLNCYLYKVNESQENEIQRAIIKNNLKHILSQSQYLDTSNFSTKLYIFDTFDLVKDDQDIHYLEYGNVEKENSLAHYLNKLYYPPLIGRQIHLQRTKIGFVNLIERFKSDEEQSLLQNIDCSENEKGSQRIFKKIQLYKIVSLDYPLDSVYIYHEKRFIFSLKTSEKQTCGVIEIPDQISVNIFKTQIESYYELNQLKNYIQGKQSNRKRSKSIVDRPMDQVKKRKQFSS